MTSEERKIFHKNFNDMLQRIGCTPYSINGSGRNGSDVAGAELAPSYSILNRCKNDPDYDPSDETVNKIVRFYNANLSPATDAYSFRHDCLISTGMARKEFSADLGQKYIGDFYGYYLSDDEPGEILAARIRVSHTAGHYQVRMVARLLEDSQLHDPRLSQMLQSKLPRDEARRAFSRYRSSLATNSLKRCRFLEGEMRVRDHSMYMHLTNVDDASDRLLITFRNQKMVIRDSYLGGLGFFLSSASEGRDSSLRKLGLSRTCLSLSDPDIAAYLTLNPAASSYLTITGSDDYDWYNMILRKESAAIRL